MALGKADVLNVLQDPKISKIDFWMGGLHICAGAYSQVAAAIRADKIHIVQGDDPEWASYFPDADVVERKDHTQMRIAANTLVTQKTAAPDNRDRALLVHECTHAYIDLSRASATTALSDEIGAYIAQAIYLMADSSYKPGRDGTRWGRMMHGVGDLVRKFRLHLPEGRGTRLQWNDYAHLRVILRGVKQYRDNGLMQPTFANGV